MLTRIWKTVLGGLRQFTEHPQLWYTVVVAAAIVIAFLYISDRFISIAKNAQDELTNVRVGAIQDAFTPLAHQLYDQPEKLRAEMQTIRELNPTIVDFFVVEEAPRGWSIAVSADPEFESSDLIGQNFLLSLAKSDTRRSFTIQEVEGTERFFRTARAITDASSTVTGVAITRQRLSEADRQIERSIQTGMITLVLILLGLLVLFFRHARIVDYTVLYKKLKEVDQLKDDFISMASHELRTPLTAIRGYADLLRDPDKLVGEKRIEALERIDISAVALDRLIAEMLDVSRIEQGRMKLELKEIDPNAIVASVHDLLAPTAEKKGLKLVLDLGSGLTISVDEDRFRQVVLNLIGNAIKYTPKGTVTVKTYAQDASCVLRVSDTGLGMSADVREHLFEKFYRAPGKEVRAQTGTGLGLWITKEIIEKMGGTISVESIEGVGSHFLATFPIAKK
jgi:signal transduction histidine kinase